MSVSRARHATCARVYKSRVSGTDDVRRPHGQQAVEEGRGGEHAGLVELLLAQVGLGVHGLQQRAQRVQRRVRARRALAPQRAHHRRAHPLAEPATTRVHYSHSIIDAKRFRIHLIITLTLSLQKI